MDGGIRALPKVNDLQFQAKRKDRLETQDSKGQSELKETKLMSLHEIN